MQKYLLRRILIFIPGLFILVLLSFFLLKNAPGNPVDQILAGQHPEMNSSSPSENDNKVRTEIIKSSTSTKEQIDQAVIDLKVLDTGGRALDPNAPNFKSDFEIVETVAFVQNFPNSTVYSFKVEFNKIVDNGKAIEQAVTIASKNKFDAKKLKELCI